MKIPKTLLICCKRIKLRIVEMPDPNYLGEYDLEKKAINLSDTLEDDEIIDYIIHEGYHAIIDLSGLGQDTTIEHEHVVINHLIPFLKDNFDIKLKIKK